MLEYPKETTDVLFHKERDSLSSKCIPHAVEQPSDRGSELDEFSSNILLEHNVKNSAFSQLAEAENISSQMKQIKALRCFFFFTFMLHLLSLSL